MTTANEIISTARNANDAMDRAAELTNNIDQDWEHEATLYEFEDASVLAVSGPSVNAYESMADARKALAA